VQIFVATGGTGIAVEVKAGVSIAGGTTDGTGEGVSVVIKFRAVGASGVGVGSVETETLHPVNRNNPISRVDISLLFITVSSLQVLTIISLVL